MQSRLIGGCVSLMTRKDINQVFPKSWPAAARLNSILNYLKDFLSLTLSDLEASAHCRNTHHIYCHVINMHICIYLDSQHVQTPSDLG